MAESDGKTWELEEDMVCLQNRYFGSSFRLVGRTLHLSLETSGTGRASTDRAKLMICTAELTTRANSVPVIMNEQSTTSTHR